MSHGANSSHSTELTHEVQKRIGIQSPVTISVSDHAGNVIAVDFTAIDSLSCSFTELRLSLPSLCNVAFDVIKKWAEQLSQRITYLLENIAPLEFDEDAGEALIRSTPPSQLPSGTQYYEIMLKTHAAGQFSLTRYRSTKGQPGRDAVEICITHEVLIKLADDLIDTMPTNTP